MAKKIVYVEPNDFIEIRVCNPAFDLGTNAAAWKESLRPHSFNIVVKSYDEIIVPHLGMTTWVRIGANLEQLLLKEK